MRGHMAKADLRIDWATHASAKFACENWHYSKSVPVPPLVKVGVWECGKFTGVVIFSRGATPSLLKPFGLKQDEGCELTRVALTRHKTQVSRIIKLALNFVKHSNPNLRIVVSFADPEEFHHGGIYQAGNWIYSGKTSTSKEYIGPNGKRWHARMIKKKGWTTVQGAIRKTLTPDQCTEVKRLGKHRYLMPLDAAMRAQIAPLAKPYPKRDKQAMASPEAQRRGSADRHAPTHSTASNP